MPIVFQLPQGSKFTKAMGFTLVELMATIAIAAVVMGLAVPSFNTAIKNNRLTTQVNDFVTSLNIARSEAVKRGQQVTLCKSSDGNTCVADGAASNWAQGWIVFVDQDNDFIHDAGEFPIRVQGQAQSQISMAGTGTVINQISYLGSGLSLNTGTIAICDDRRDEAVGKLTTINAVGRASTTDELMCGP